MAKLTIDGKELEVEDGLTVIQACEKAGVEIPRFCYHEKLSIAGNCRMCLVEMERAPKLIASCAMPVSEGMVIKTDTEKVKNAREGVMELLLINHPLDCPICDQGGECDLQDQAYAYGRGGNRFAENKRAVKDKYLGPLIKTHMTRCIQCTRCIRFSDEIAGTQELGAVYRGEHMEITTYLESSLSSELSGNLVDVCPVGALTSKPYEFKARNWEMRHVESIDVLDAVGSNIRVDYRGLSVMRIQPRINEDINEEWISDKTRYSYDGLKNQRLDVCYVRKDGKLVETSWKDAFETVSTKLKKTDKKNMLAVCGPMADAESIYALKTFFNKMGSKNLDFNQYGHKFDVSARGNYLFNTSIAGIEESDFCLLIGANPRHDATMLNARLRKAVLNNNLHVARIGKSDDQTYHIEELGNDLYPLKQLALGRGDLAKRMKAAKNPMIIIGDAIYSRDDAMAIYGVLHKIVQKYKIMRDDWSGFNILHKYASNIAALDLNFYPVASNKGLSNLSKIDFLYSLGADDIDFDKLPEKSFVVYQGHHGDKGASRADVIFPGAAYTEKEATYINLEGRMQYTRRAIDPPGEALEDWKILHNLASALNLDLGFTDLSSVRSSMRKASKSFISSNKLLDNDFVEFTTDEVVQTKVPLEKIETNYYMTDVISRASKTMSECVTAAQERAREVA